ncbi:sugar phosphate isomerase/epimerase family protein [Hydrogenophaga electricum]|uniref:Xylose isomerase n=1 Tax=Hydrogenophaga electricum TaxID=1230953 RepID=A0ABQ6CBD1_9BURK|nr:TIM barrel protein [Hydrogenophaga electricum]GLS15989.1 xylose isomerase [Hydrogenophaga electricum]
MRPYSLAYLNAHRCTPPEAVRVAAATGYQFAGLRLWPNGPSAPQQFLIDRPDVLRETLAALADTGVGIFDVEIIRIGDSFDPHTWDSLYDACAALKAKAILVAGDDTNEARLTENYARLCEVMAPYGLTADLEFMPWTAVKDANTALRVVQNAGMPANAGILVDALHFGRSTTTLDDIRALPRQLLHYAQICDATAGTHFSTEDMIHTARCARLLPGEGNIDVRGLFAALPADLPVSVEVVHHEREKTADPTQWAATCLAASRPFTG